jgi:hypothetical protein
LLWDGASPEAIAIAFGCPTCPASTTRLFRDPQGRWNTTPQRTAPTVESQAATERNVAAQRQAVAAGRVEVRTVAKRQLFIDGRPVGDFMD